MGMFDYINYQGQSYQTKDTPAQYTDTYEIRDDGTLWHKAYDTSIIKDPRSFFGAYYKKENIRWEFCKEFDGLIVFYRNAVADNPNSERIEHKALFSDGKMIKLNGKML